MLRWDWPVALLLVAALSAVVVGRVLDDPQQDLVVDAATTMVATANAAAGAQGVPTTARQLYVERSVVVPPVTEGRWSVGVVEDGEHVVLVTDAGRTDAALDGRPEDTHDVYVLHVAFDDGDERTACIRPGRVESVVAAVEPAGCV